jgi:hypothetical protein
VRLVCVRACPPTPQLLHHHNNKPFIRGGDFDRRKASGERVMQLQYSRAFGGKDLKPFGLSAEPGVRQVALTADMVLRRPFVPPPPLHAEPNCALHP